MPFLTSIDLSSYLGTTFTADEQARAQKMIDAVIAAAEDMVGYSFATSVRQYYVDGGEHRVWLPEPGEVVDFTEPMSVTIYNDNTDLYEPLVPVRPLRLRQDASIDLHGIGYGVEAVEITYTAGWDDDRPMPADLKQALLELIAAKWSINMAAVASNTSTDTSDAAVKSITIGTLRTEFAVGSDTAGSNAKLQSQAVAAVDTLSRYKRMKIF